MTGNYQAPTVLVDDDRVIDGIRNIIAWAQSHPRQQAPSAGEREARYPASTQLTVKPAPLSRNHPRHITEGLCGSPSWGCGAASGCCRGAGEWVPGDQARPAVARA